MSVLPTVESFKAEFLSRVNTSHIKYDRDGGHSYSYIEHPLMDLLEEVWAEVDEDKSMYEEVVDFTNYWLSENDDMPVCDIHVDHLKKEISSGCGCHDSLHYYHDMEEWTSILLELKKESA